MNQLFNGSLNLTELVNQAKSGHSAFNKAKNGNVYCNVTIWLNENADQYGNHMSLMLNSHKDKKRAGRKEVYR